jgi:hypothetical protein
MKVNSLIFLCLMAVTTLDSQPKILDKRIDIKKGQTLYLDFSYTTSVNLATWENPYIHITGSYIVNEGENNEAFKLEVEETLENVTISQYIANLEELPKVYTIKNGMEEFKFKNKMDLEDYQKNNPGAWTSQYSTTNITVILEIKVPKDTRTEILNKYGIIEIPLFAGPLSASSKYGGIDIHIPNKTIGNIDAIAKFGEIYTDLDWPVNKGKDENFKTKISGNFGLGYDYNLSSEFGNLYLRKLR